ncbi:lymphocyte-specific protein 1 isoform X2 [Talpa occidentalis]|uniref:lymphocyte-specific protein 1 isoform X2 n=1 Tax=Talpa occidentalis TaxID=50954 RepID=UPI00188F359E|nr:lymphocyte-specific protein 1 isoform X2 [Talpa occidentalis]
MGSPGRPRKTPQTGPGEPPRLTAQWSEEDEEEAARERHPRAQAGAEEDEAGAGGGRSSPERPEREKLLEPADPDEDEGFGDWSQKPEQQQPWGPGEPEGPGVQAQPDRPCLHVCGAQDVPALSSAQAGMEELCLSPGSGPQELGPAEAPRGSLGAQAEKQDQPCQEPRTPRTLALEATAEQGSPPLSPSTKLSGGAEALDCSLTKSGGMSKPQMAVPTSKIDQWLEQYTQAVETAARAPKPARQVSIELPSMAVANTKSLWESGEVQAQSAAKSAPCKDVVAGDMSKKGLWEQKGAPAASSTMKSTPSSGKKFRFVATGHGKYEKVPVDTASAP